MTVFVRENAFDMNVYYTSHRITIPYAFSDDIISYTLGLPNNLSPEKFVSDSIMRGHREGGLTARSKNFKTPFSSRY